MATQWEIVDEDKPATPETAPPTAAAKQQGFWERPLPPNKFRETMEAMTPSLPTALGLAVGGAGLAKGAKAGWEALKRATPTLGNILTRGAQAGVPLAMGQAADWIGVPRFLTDIYLGLKGIPRIGSPAREIGRQMRSTPKAPAAGQGPTPSAPSAPAPPATRVPPGSSSALENQLKASLEVANLGKARGAAPRDITELLRLLQGR